MASSVWETGMAPDSEIGHIGTGCPRNLMRIRKLRSTWSDLSGSANMTLDNLHPNGKLNHWAHASNIQKYWCWLEICAWRIRGGPIKGLITLVHGDHFISLCTYNPTNMMGCPGFNKSINHHLLLVKFPSPIQRENKWTRPVVFCSTIMRFLDVFWDVLCVF